MPPPFQELDPSGNPADFVRLLARFPFERKVTAVHLHQTGRLSRGDWRGHQTLRTIWYAQTLQLGWSDIAQHLTIAPDGGVWTGRDWNRPPCSFPGQNGTRREGPFMITVVGDFCDGRDSCEGAQLEQLADVIAQLHTKFEVSAETIRFHPDLGGSADMTCPGGALLRGSLSKALAARRSAVATTVAKMPARFGAEPFGEDAENWYQFITSCNQYRQQPMPSGTPTPSTPR